MRYRLRSWIKKVSQENREVWRALELLLLFQGSRNRLIDFVLLCTHFIISQGVAAEGYAPLFCL